MSERVVFESKNPAEFFLAFKETAGLSNPQRVLYLSLRELIENSLDACETIRRLPYVNSQITRTVLNEFEIKCVDNGCGVPEKYIPRAFGQLFYGSKYLLKQSRGLFGFGAKLICLYGQTETGRPLRVMSSTNGKVIHKFILKTDIANNQPEVIQHQTIENKNQWIGTGLAFHTKGDLRKALPLIIDYLSESNLINPYAVINLKIEDKTIQGEPILLNYARIVNSMPMSPRAMLPHPSSISRMQLVELLNNSSKNIMLKDFLRTHLHRVGRKTAEDFLEKMSIRDKNIQEIKTNEADIRILHQALQTYPFSPPDIRYLSILGEAPFTESVQRKFNPAFISYSSKSSSYSGYPFAIEVVIGYLEQIPQGSDEESFNLHRYCNRMPLITEYHDAIYKVLKGINFKRYRFDDVRHLVFFVHLISVKIPFKSQAKESIAEVDEIMNKVELSLKEALRNLSVKVSKRKRIQAQSKKWSIIKFYLGKLSKFTCESLDKPIISPNLILQRYSTEIKKEEKDKIESGTIQHN